MSPVTWLNIITVGAIIGLIIDSPQAIADDGVGGEGLVMVGWDCTRCMLAGALFGSLTCSLQTFATHNGPADKTLWLKVISGFLASTLCSVALSGAVYEMAPKSYVSKTPAIALAVGYLVGICSHWIVPKMQEAGKKWFNTKTGLED